jgi:hypothetical protein
VGVKRLGLRHGRRAHDDARYPIFEYADHGVDGVHDMGGMHGFGPVVEPGSELPYRERWEPRVFAIQMLVGLEGLGAGPGGRPVREEMDPAHYLAASYYERWLYSAEQRLLRKGTIAPGEVERAMERLEAGESVRAHHDAAMAERIVADLRSVYPMDTPPADARFGPGEWVRVKRMHPAGHTRCPRYAVAPPVWSSAYAERTACPTVLCTASR